MPSNNPLINPTHVGMIDKTKQYRIVIPWSWLKTKDGHDISNEPKRGGRGGAAGLNIFLAGYEGELNSLARNK